MNPDDDKLRISVIKVNGTYNGGSPQLTISGDNGYTYTEQWDATNKEYTLTLNHNGQVNIQILANQAGSGNPTLLCKLKLRAVYYPGMHVHAVWLPYLAANM